MRLRLTGAAALVPGDGAERRLDRHGALIALRLALAGPQPRALLATGLWPDLAPARARANLRQRLLRLKALGRREWIVGEAVLQLAPDVQVLPWDAAGAAELLEGLSGAESEAWAGWLQQMRAEQRARQLQSLARAAIAAEAAEDWSDALAAVGRMVALEPHAEAHRRHLMRLHYLNHDTPAARVVYAGLQRMLRDEFGTVPGAQTRELLALLEQAAAPMAGAARRVPGRVAVALQRPPRMIGRAAELATLTQAVDDGGAVLVLGEPGMGKSRLLAELLLSRSGVLGVKAEPGDAAVPYATLSRLLRRLLQRSGEALPATLEPWLPEAPGSASAAVPPERTALPLRAVVAPLLEGAGLSGVLVDDLHFADDASIEMLQALAAATGAAEDIGAPPPAWLLAQRPDEGSPAAHRLRCELVAARRLSVLPLRPLDAAHMTELLQSLALPGMDPLDWAARLMRHTGGNPLFALETLKQQLGEGKGGSALPQPLPVTALIDRRLQRLSERALALARTAAIAGPDFNAGLASAVLARPLVELADAWAELEAAQVLRDSAFAHDLVFEAALRSVPQAVARHLHGAVAAWLQGHGGEPARVAAHWLGAAAPQQAAPWLLQAADRAHRQLRPREEAAFLGQLVECVEADNPAEAARTLLRLARVQTEAHGFAASAALLQRALHLVLDDAQRVRLLNLMAEIQFNRLMPDASAQAAAEALALARSLADEPAAAEAVVRWHRALCMNGQSARAQALWAEHQSWMAAVPLPSAELVSDRGWVLDRLGQARQARAWHARALTLARSSSRPVDEAVVLGNLAQSHLLGGEPAAAEAAIDRAEALCTHHDGLHAASDYLPYQRAAAAAMAGRFGEALGHFERALADSTAQSPQARLAVLAQRALLWVAIGQHGRAHVDASEVLAEAGSAASLRAHAHHAMALATQPGGPGLRVGLQRALDALGDPAQTALEAPIHLRIQLADSAADPAQAPLALAWARGLLRQSRRNGHPGQRWLAHWAAAQLALAARRPLAARRHALACLTRPAAEVAPPCNEGVWWHAIWRVWLGLGEPTRAEAAREAGLAWLRQTQQQHLPEAFHPSFRDGVPAHRDLLHPP